MPGVLEVSSVDEAGSKVKETLTYFSGLHGLRAIAAITVLLVHVELLKAMHGFPHLWNDITINAAQRAVTFFFVLSGFLITYLLFSEKQHQGNINIKSFYKRRILRIWPLYFLFFLIGILSIDIYDKYMLRTILLYLLLLPNLSIAFGFGLPNAYMTWSIGVEEQFYLIWPWLMKNKGKFVGICIIVVFVFLLFRNISRYFSEYFVNQTINQYLRHISDFFEMTSLGAMAIGGLMAYNLFFNNEYSLRYLLNKRMFITVVSILFLLFYFAAPIPFINTEVYSLLFAVLIVNIAKGKGALSLLLENKLLRFLGKISYGIYMYNLIIIKLCMYLFKDFLQARFSTIYHHLLFTIFSCSITIFVAWISYQVIEKRFLRLKWA